MSAAGPWAAVILDNDGLTLDSETVWTRAEVVLFARRGRTFTHAHKLELVGSAGPIAAAKLERMLELPAGDGAAVLARARRPRRRGARARLRADARGRAR